MSGCGHHDTTKTRGGLEARKPRSPEAQKPRSLEASGNQSTTTAWTSSDLPTPTCCVEGKPSLIHPPLLKAALQKEHSKSVQAIIAQLLRFLPTVRISKTCPLRQPNGTPNDKRKDCRQRIIELLIAQGFAFLNLTNSHRNHGGRSEGGAVQDGPGGGLGKFGLSFLPGVCMCVWRGAGVEKMPLIFVLAAFWQRRRRRWARLGTRGNKDNNAS